MTASASEVARLTYPIVAISRSDQGRETRRSQGRLWRSRPEAAVPPLAVASAICRPPDDSQSGFHDCRSLRPGTCVRRGPSASAELRIHDGFVRRRTPRCAEVRRGRGGGRRGSSRLLRFRQGPLWRPRAAAEVPIGRGWRSSFLDIRCVRPVREIERRIGRSVRRARAEGSPRSTPGRALG